MQEHHLSATPLGISASGILQRQVASFFLELHYTWAAQKPAAKTKNWEPAAVIPPLPHLLRSLVRSTRQKKRWFGTHVVSHASSFMFASSVFSRPMIRLHPLRANGSKTHTYTHVRSVLSPLPNQLGERSVKQMSVIPGTCLRPRTWGANKCHFPFHGGTTVR